MSDSRTGKVWNKLASFVFMLGITVGVFKEFRQIYGRRGQIVNSLFSESAMCKLTGLL